MKKLSYLKGIWGGYPEVLIEELRAREVFIGLAGQTDASPYWYGTILDYVKLKKVLPLIKKSRRAEIVETYKENDLSPMVRLLGCELERLWKD